VEHKYPNKWTMALFGIALFRNYQNFEK